MGIKECKVWLSCLLSFIILYTTIETTLASTAEDVYLLYGEDISIEDYDEQISVIQKYNEAEKYVTMYQYIIYSEYDTTIVDNRISELETKLNDVKKQLVGGYNKSLDEIYELETLYKTYLVDLEEAKKSLVTYDINVKTPAASDIPTYSEYAKAKDTIRIKEDLGTIGSTGVPIDAPTVELEKTETHITYRTLWDSDVKALLSGRIVKIKNGTVTVNHGANMYTLYDGLDSVNYSKGQFVKQGTVIGKSKDTVTFKFKLNGKLRDVTKLFEEVR